MRKYLLLLPFLGSWMFFSCSNNPSDKTSLALQKYLSEVFHTGIPDTLHYFVLMPENGCKSCVKQMYDFAHEGSLASNVTCIHLKRDVVNDVFSPIERATFLTGDFLDANNYDFFSGGVVIYRTRLSQIDTVIYPNSLNLTDVLTSEGILKEETQ
jgi:hypothetical protein